jgi:hypothetical protein
MTNKECTLYTFTFLIRFLPLSLWDACWHQCSQVVKQLKYIYIKGLVALGNVLHKQFQLLSSTLTIQPAYLRNIEKKIFMRICKQLVISSCQISDININILEFLYASPIKLWACRIYTVMREKSFSMLLHIMHSSIQDKSYYVAKHIIWRYKPIMTEASSN